MKINEKQLTIIFCLVFVLLIGVTYFLSQSSKDLPPAPQTIKRVQNISPLSAGDEALVEKMHSEKLAPLSKKDEVLIQQMNASGPVNPLSAEEEAFIKKMKGI